MIHDTLAGMAQLKAPPLRWRIVFALLAAEVDDHAGQVSLRDLAELTGVGQHNARWVNREAMSLVRDGFLDRLKIGGKAGNVYRIRPPEDWPADAWRVDRVSGAANMTAVAEARAARKADVFAQQPRAQRPVVRAVTRALARQIVAADQGERDRSARAHARTSDAESAGAHYLPDEELRSSLSKQGTNEIEVSDDRGNALANAVLAGCHAAGNDGPWLSPAQRGRIEHVALEANGRLPEILELARRPDGPRSTLTRIELLELALVAPEADRARPRVDPRIADLRSTLRALELCGEGDSEDARALREQLDMLQP